MMKKFVSTIAALGSISAVATGCAYDYDKEASEPAAGTSEEAVVCANPDGTNAMIAGLASAIGRELHRWQITKDFEIYRGYQSQEMLRLTTTGKAQCANNNCPMVTDLLAYQDSRLDQQYVFPGNVKLSSWSYAARLTTGWKNQKTCDDRPNNNHNANTCPAEEHYLTLLTSAPGGCSVMNTFNTRKAGPANPVVPLAYADQLLNKLLWAGGKDNPYLMFKATGQQVEVDPGFGSGEGDPLPVVQPGACVVACNNYNSTTVITGQCCQCNGVNSTFKKQGMTANTYKCG